MLLNPARRPRLAAAVFYHDMMDLVTPSTSSDRAWAFNLQVNATSNLILLKYDNLQNFSVFKMADGMWEMGPRA